MSPFLYYNIYSKDHYLGPERYRGTIRLPVDETQLMAPAQRAIWIAKDLLGEDEMFKAVLSTKEQHEKQPLNGVDVSA